MRQIFLGMFLFCLFLCSLANSKTLTVPDQFSTVQKAIEAAASGDTIEVKPGLYNETLTFKDGITLIGTDRAKSILAFDTRKSPLLTATNCQGVIRNLTFQSEGINSSPDKEKYNPLLMFTKSSVKVDNCVLQKSCGNGINIEAGSQCEVTHCLVQNNRRNGIIVIGKGTSATLQDNQCIHNGLNGLGFGNEATGVAKGNECRDNDRCGLSIEKEKLVRCEENQCQNNGDINQGYLRNLLFQENFNELESIVEQLRIKKPRRPSGEWQLSFYYKYLAGSWDITQPSQATKAEQLLDKWRKSKSASITPVILLGDLYTDLAWQSRTAKWASEVTEEGWKGFKEYLQKAWALLSSSENDKINDPMFYRSSLTVRVLGMGHVDEMDKLFAKGIAIQKNFYPLYYNKAYILTPRWYGKPGDTKAFMEKADEDNSETKGDSLYARIAANLLICIGGSGVKELKLDYERIKKGHEEILKKYPDATSYLNTYCRFACLYKDHEQAKFLMENIGNNWDKTVWQNEQFFEQNRRWANSKPIPFMIAAPTTQTQKP